MKKPTKKKQKFQNVLLAKVPTTYQGIQCYCPVDASDVKTIADKQMIECQIPVDGRSLPQNALWAVWYNQVSKTLAEHSPAQVKQFCKLTYAVPILIAEDKHFRGFFNGAIAHLTYEQQLYCMRYVPVTSLLTKDQGQRYQRAIQDGYADRINLMVM